ncbi:MAG: hypothetical protein CVU05_06710 [Bacteroidetes bacterium HGW-Bacteroidetes-21]|jgi:hypothetical protein|nr:MAG: hypothetical protein CVU05_06710 [Bacteroidetes bacterium HGW-Bacteroidetes-21]
MKSENKHRIEIENQISFLYNSIATLTDKDLMSEMNRLIDIATSCSGFSEDENSYVYPMCKTIIDFAGEGIIYQEVSGVIRKWNRFAEEIFGVKASEVVGQTSTSFNWQTYHEDGRVFLGEEHPSMITLKTGQSCRDVIMKIVRSDSSFRWISVNTNPVFCPDNRGIMAVVITFSDITEKKKIELELKKSEQMYRLIAENSGDNITVFDLELNATYVSPNIMKLRGYTSEEALKHKMDEICTPTSLQLVYSTLQEHMELEKQKDADPHRYVIMEVEEYHKEGHTVWLEVTVSFMRDEQMRPIGIISVSRDMTEKKKFQKKIQESEEKFLKAFQNSPVVVTITSLDDGKYIEVNDAFVRETGYSREEVLGKTSEELNFFADIKERQILVEDLKIKGVISEREMLIKGKSGEQINALVSISILSLNDCKYMLSTVVNITERKKAEKALKTSDRIIKHALDMICVAGFDGYFKEVNPSWSRTLGWSKEELLSKPWIGFVHPEDKNATDNIKKVIINGKEILQFENRYLCKNGSYKWLSWNTYPYPEENVMFGVARDVTEQKLAQRAVFESEEKYRLITEFASDVIWVLNLTQNRFTYISPSIQQLRGLTVEEALAEKLEDALTPDSQVKIAAIISDNMESFLKGNENSDYLVYEIQQPCKNGEIIWVEVSTKFRKNKFDEIEVIGVSRNITERKHYLENMELSEKKFRELFEFNRDGIVIFLLNENFTIAEVNSAAYNMVGLTYEEAKVTNPLLMEKDTSPELIADRIQQLHEKRQLTAETIIIHRSGKEIPVRIDSQIILYNHMPAIMSVLKDLSALKNVEKEFFQLEKNYYEIFNSTNDAIIIADSETGRIMDVNKSTLNLLEYNSREEILAAELCLMCTEIPPYTKEVSDELIKKTMEEGPQTFEWMVKKKSGEIFWTEISLNKTDIGGKNHVLAVLRDISDRKVFEEKLIAAKEKAQENDRLKSAFLANMSHEIRTPMNGILGFSEMLEDRNLDNNTRENYIGIIRRCGNQLLTIVNDLIDISKIEANQLKIVKERVNLNEMFYDLHFLANNAKIVAEVEINIHLSLPDNESYIIADGNRWRQVIHNLIQNAKKFTKKGSIDFGYHVKGEEIEIFVKDTGIGIPIEQIDSVFERFKQVENDLTRKPGGVGLGLAITKSLVEAMNGKIEVESVYGIGSSFIITMPYEKAEAETTKSVGKVDFLTLPEQNKFVVLVVEDELYNFIYLRELLQKLQIEIQHAETGEEAVEMLQQNQSISLILMDIRLPGIDGKEATRRIKEINSRIPIIAQTAYATNFEKETLMKNLFDDYLDKPIQKEKLLEILGKYLK